MNGRLMGSHEGMFSRVVYEATALMENDNELEVLLVGQKDATAQKITFIDNAVSLERIRIKKLKAQYSYGWDFAPAMKNAGIWDDVWLHETGPVTIDDLWIVPDVNGLIHAEVHLTSRAAGDGELKWRIEPVDHDYYPIGAEESDE